MLSRSMPLITDIVINGPSQNLFSAAKPQALTLGGGDISLVSDELQRRDFSLDILIRMLDFGAFGKSNHTLLTVGVYKVYYPVI